MLRKGSFMQKHSIRTRASRLGGWSRVQKWSFVPFPLLLCLHSKRQAMRLITAHKSGSGQFRDAA